MSMATSHPETPAILLLYEISSNISTENVANEDIPQLCLPEIVKKDLFLLNIFRFWMRRPVASLSHVLTSCERSDLNVRSGNVFLGTSPLAIRSWVT